VDDPSGTPGPSGLDRPRQRPPPPPMSRRGGDAGVEVNLPPGNFPLLPPPVVPPDPRPFRDRQMGRFQTLYVLRVQLAESGVFIKQSPPPLIR